MRYFSFRTLGAFMALTPAAYQGCSTLQEQPGHKELPPNFIFIAIDDLNTFNTVLGDESGVFLQKVYPDDETREEVLERLTPNLERFAEQSMVFANAYCPSPLCGPSRTALLTGVPTHISGYYAHEKHFRHYENMTDLVTLPQYLRDHGYYTGGIGKVFHKPIAYLDRGEFSDWPDRLFSWDEWVDAYAGTGPAASKGAMANEQLSRYWDQGDLPKNHFTRFGITDLEPENSNDYTNAELIAQLILEGTAERTDVHGHHHVINVPDDRPYFLACGLFAPHLPWVAAQQFYNRFPMEEMEINRALRDWVVNDIKDLSATGKRIAATNSFTRLLDYGRSLDGSEGDLNAWKAAFQAYLATIAFSDYCFGVLMDAIENNPAYENTIVVVWSDHGYHLGDKNREGKTTLWEASNHCNLMILDPKIKACEGTISHAMVGLQDLYPTVVSMAGLDRPSHVYGYNLVPLMEQSAETEWNHPVLSTFQEGNHTIRTSRYRYIRFRNGDQELYDMVNDQFEVNNLVNDPGSAVLVDSLDRILNEMLAMGPGDFKSP